LRFEFSKPTRACVASTEGVGAATRKDSQLLSETQTVAGSPRLLRVLACSSRPRLAWTLRSTPDGSISTPRHGASPSSKHAHGARAPRNDQLVRDFRRRDAFDATVAPREQREIGVVEGGAELDLELRGISVAYGGDADHGAALLGFVARVHGK